jgi:hypothetical protein
MRVRSFELFVALVVMCIFCGCNDKDRMVNLGSKLFLSYDGIQWCLLDGRRSSSNNGGIVIVQSIDAIAVVDSQAVLGKSKGKYFIAPMSMNDFENVMVFNTEDDWVKACSRYNLTIPALDEPNTFANSFSSHQSK